MTDTPSPLGTIFDEDAELYDKVRPTYPPELLDDIGDLAGLTPASRVLEIGCGTGQATVGLAERGYGVVALEPGASMAEVARRKLGRFPNVRVVESAFEAWPLPDRPFDAVVAATSFHWVDRALRVTKAADALRIGGAVAIISTHHVAGGDTVFFNQAQACYERFDPATPPGLTLPPESEIPSKVDELEHSTRFGSVTVRRYGWEKTYSAAEYTELLMSYSGHRALERRARRGLLDCIEQLINEGFGGSITKRYLFQLGVAKRIRSSRRPGGRAE